MQHDSSFILSTDITTLWTSNMYSRKSSHIWFTFSPDGFSVKAFICAYVFCTLKKANPKKRFKEIEVPIIMWYPRISLQNNYARLSNTVCTQQNSNYSGPLQVLRSRLSLLCIMQGKMLIIYLASEHIYDIQAIVQLEYQVTYAKIHCSNLTIWPTCLL